MDCHVLNDAKVPQCPIKHIRIPVGTGSKAVKWYETTDITNPFFLIPLTADCRPWLVFTWRGIQYIWQSKAPEDLQ